MTASLPKEIEFARNGPFYDLVTAFSLAVCGLESVIGPENLMKFQPGQAVALKGNIKPVFRLEPFVVREFALKGKIPFPFIVSSLCGMLVNTAYEAVKARNDQSPLFEFFRHVRNACSHRNRFFFTGSEPSRKAEWRGLKISSLQKGTAHPLYNKVCFNSFLGIADGLLLLWDIEQHLTSGGT